MLVNVALNISWLDTIELVHCRGSWHRITTLLPQLYWNDTKSNFLKAWETDTLTSIQMLEEQKICGPYFFRICMVACQLYEHYLELVVFCSPENVFDWIWSLRRLPHSLLNYVRSKDIYRLPILSGNYKVMVITATFFSNVAACAGGTQG